jgi:hypothetical protein
VRGEVAHRRFDGGRVAGVTAVPVRGEDRQVGVQRTAPLHQVVRVQRRRPQPPARRPEPAYRPQPQPVEAAERLEGAPGTQRHQQVAHSAAPVQGEAEARRPQLAVLRAAAPEVLGAGRPRQPVGQVEDGGEVVEHPAEEHRAPALQVGAAVEEGEEQVVLPEDLEVPAAGGVQDASLAALPVVHAHLVEQRDRLRGHQQRIRPRGVLVVAGGEGHPDLGEEAAPVGLVPGDHDQPQQAGVLVEREDLRSGPGEQRAELVALRVAVPVCAVVVEDQQVGVAGPVDPGRDGLQRAGGVGVVAVQEEHVVATGPGEAGVAGHAQADVLGEVQDAHPAVPGGVGVGDLTAAVR